MQVKAFLFSSRYVKWLNIPQDDLKQRKIFDHDGRARYILTKLSIALKISICGSICISSWWKKVDKKCVFSPITVVVLHWNSKKVRILKYNRSRNTVTIDQILNASKLRQVMNKLSNVCVKYFWTSIFTSWQNNVCRTWFSIIKMSLTFDQSTCYYWFDCTFWLEYYIYYTGTSGLS